MILCVNPNAAIDKTAVVENFHLNAIHRPSFELALPGGKGCNVARAAKTLGRQPVVTGWIGGHAGRFIEEGLQAEGIQTAFVHTAVESRTCLSILDPAQGTMTEIYEKGRPVSADELQSFYDLFQRRLPEIKVVTLSGSLPPGVTVDFYANVTRLAREAGVMVLLDSSGEPLRSGVEQGRPDVLKCNRAELSGLVGQPLEDLEDVKQAARELSRRWEMTVVITLGSSGAVLAESPLSGGSVWLAQAPRVEAISAVGSGDAFLAGFACALLDHQPVKESLRLAVSAGTANTLHLGAGCLRPEDVARLLGHVRIDIQG